MEMDSWSIEVVPAALLKPLKEMVAVAERKEIMPILTHVLVSAKDDRLMLTASDTEIQLEWGLLLPGAPEGSAAVPARRLLDICRLLADAENLRFEFAEGKATLRAGRGRYTLPTLPADSFPNFAHDAGSETLVLAAEALAKALGKVDYAMGINDVRYYLNGTLLQFGLNEIVFTASDGSRLAQYRLPADLPDGTNADLILPAKAVKELLRLLGGLDKDDTLTVRFTRNAAAFSAVDWVLHAKLIDAKYPDFNKVFNHLFNEPVGVGRIALKNALARVTAVVDDVNMPVSLEAKEGLLVVSHRDQSDEALPANHDGNSFHVSASARFLADALDNMDSEQVLLAIPPEPRSILLTDPGDDALRVIVMPLSL